MSGGATDRGEAASAARGGARARNRRLRERAYLDAAMEIAATDGLATLTMSRLAGEVDAAVGTVYTYFPSKGALMAELQREAVERLTASYHLVRDRSEADLAEWDDAQAVAVARLAVFGAFWIAAADTLPHEAALLHGLVSVADVFVPPEERHRVLPAALALLGEARSAVAGAAEAGVIVVDDPTELVVRWAASLTGVLLTANLAPVDVVVIDPRRLAAQLQRDLLVGWGARPDLVDLADGHIGALAAQGPLAPPPPAA
jgi:AcrR family transcriptional regulator